MKRQLRRAWVFARITTVVAVLMSWPAAGARAETPPERPIGWASVNAWGQNGTTGGTGGPTVTVSTEAEFVDYISRPGPYVIQVNGMIALTGQMRQVSSDKTIVGLGTASGITGAGLNIGLNVNNTILAPPANAVRNVIIRNMVFRDFPDDAINVQMFSHHIWIDHNDLSNAADGLVDIKRGSSYITVSWNHTHHQSKNMLLGHDDANGAQDVGQLKVTYHHNWFDGTIQRNPRARFGEPVHVFNNYYFSNSDVGVACQADAGCWVEGNYFENVEEPMTPYYAGPAGRIFEQFNFYVNSGPPVALGTVENPSQYYAYTLDNAADIKMIVMAGAGVGGTVTPPTPDFSIAANPPNLSFTQSGGIATFNVQPTLINNFTDAITLTHAWTGTVPTGVTVTPASGLSTGSPVGFTVTSIAGALPGTFTLTITGTSGSPTLTRTTTVAVVVLGNPSMQSPTVNAAGTTTGDRNGFEVTPANAYADDGLYAGDVNSGTASGTTCTSTNRDRHDFSGYGLTVPAGSTVTGVEVRLDALVESTSSSPRMCVQLSWDGGFSWTTAQQTPNLTTSEATYTLGGSTNTWGRTWTTAELSNANFRLRVIPTASSSQRDFSLDWVAVKVHHAVAIPGDFTISATPGSSSINAGASTTYTININRLDGLSGDVMLSVSGLGAGATASFNPYPASGTSSTLTIATTTTAATGSRTLMINATSGDLTRTTTVTLVVNGSQGCQGQC